MNKIRLSERVPDALAGQRLDQALAQLFSHYSRSRLTRWIKSGEVSVDGRSRLRPRDRVIGGEQIEILARLDESPDVLPQAIPLEIIFADDSLLIINKPAGLVVHPAVGHRDGTLQNALVHYDSRLAALPRGGIVHRLDKDTSGLMVVARNLSAHKSLVEQLQARSVSREYQAVTQGVMTAGGRIEVPIGRHAIERKRMAVTPTGKDAITHYRVLKRFRAHTHVRVNLETGRTHQIRVHMAHIRHPLLGDPVYGGRLRIPAGCSPALITALRGFKRQALHAVRLRLLHPQTGIEQTWEAPLPDDMQQLLAVLKADTGYFADD